MCAFWGWLPQQPIEAGETCSKHGGARLLELALNAVFIAVRRRRPRGTGVHAEHGI